MWMNEDIEGMVKKKVAVLKEMAYVHIWRLHLGVLGLCWAENGSSNKFSVLNLFLGKFHPSALDVIVDFFARDWLALKTFLQVAMLRLELAELYVV